MQEILIKNFYNRLKSIEKKNIKKYKRSLTWISLEYYFNKCIIEVREKTIIIDEQEYKNIKKQVTSKEFNKDLKFNLKEV